MITPLINWAKDIPAYWRFVIKRRPDPKHPLIARKFLSVGLPLWILLFVLVIGLTVQFIDPLYRDWLAKEMAEKGEQTITDMGGIFRLFSALANPRLVVNLSVTIIVIMTIFSARWFKGHHYAIWHSIIVHAIFFFVAINLIGVLQKVLKTFFGRTRPFAIPEDQIWAYNPFQNSFVYESFPSGHASVGAVLAMALALFFPKAKWFFIALGILVAISRPAMGLHFPADVIAGFVLGTALSWFLARVLARKRLLFQFSPEGKITLRPTRYFKRHKN